MTIKPQTLTDRELEILGLVAEGNSNKIIGGRLGISKYSVKNRMTAIMAKLNANDRTHAVVMAVRLGYLEL